MTDEVQAAEEAAPEVVEATAEEAVTPEEAQTTKGQEETPPAEEEGEKPESEEVSKSKARRERRKAEMERLRTEAQEAEAKLAQQRERLQKAQEAAQSNTPPKETDFADYQEYLVALGAFHASSALDKRQSAEIEEATQAEQARLEALHQQTERELAESWADQVADARERYSDFEKVAFSAPISDDLAKMVATSDMGADVAYYLGSNRALAAELSQKTSIEQAMALGRIEATLSLPKPNLQPQAPDPVTPVKTRATGLKDPSKMTMAEYKAAREAGKL